MDEFQRHYIVSAPDSEATCQFLEETILRRLAQTRLLIIHAEGELFTLSQIKQVRKS